MKKPKIPNLVTIFILTTITIVFWAFFGIYRVFTKQPSPTVPSEILEPLSPTLDTDSLNKIESRTFFEDSQIPQTKFLLGGTQTSPTPTPTPSPRVTITPTPTATASGGLTQ